jgi:prepilin-type N-terminal cleavage/methylation domain-containing protein
MKMQIRRNRTQGFTLVEIMIVVSIIALLAGIAIPGFVRARNTSATNACFNNLRDIDGAKQQWALENNKVNGDTPSNIDVTAYLKGNAMPGCPAGGVYTIADVGTTPSCSFAGHTY